jgi:predicted RNA polymerase sigma factor
MCTQVSKMVSSHEVLRLIFVCIFHPPIRAIHRTQLTLFNLIAVICDKLYTL